MRISSVRPPSGRHFSVLVFLVSCLGTTGLHLNLAFAQTANVRQIDACKLISQVQPGDERNWWGKIINLFKFENSKSEQDAANTQNNEKTILKYTIRSDFARRPICKGRKRIANSIYYPVGLVVRQIDKVRIGRTIFDLVETEYGMRIYIPPSHLEKLDPDFVYIFANSARRLPFCPSEKCSGQQRKSAIDRGLILWPTTPNSAYAIVSENKEINKAKNLCDNFKANITRVSSHTGYKPKTVAQGYVNTCVVDDLTGDLIAVEDMTKAFDSSYKVVTYAKYLQLFDTKIGGAYFSLNDIKYRKLFEEARISKECSVTFRKSDKKLIKGGAQIKGDLLLVEVTAAAAAERVIENVTKLSDQIFSLHSPYLLRFSDLSPATSGISVMYSCDVNKIYPEKPYRLELDFSGIEDVDDVLSLSNKQLTETYEEYFKNKKEVARVDCDAYRQGKLWRIGGAFGYFQMRDVLYDHIFYSSSIDYLVSEGDKSFVERERVANFLTHIIMAATSEFKIIKKRRKKIHACAS